MGARFPSAVGLEQRVHMLLGTFSANGVSPLKFKLVYSVGDLLTQHLDELEHEVERTEGTAQALTNHFTRVITTASPFRQAA
jgi:hypothetical protein